MLVRRRFAAILAALGVGGVALSIGQLAAAGVPVLDQDPVDLGAVTIVDGNDQITPIESGGSNTVFTMLPPDGSTCPGDSANDQWRIQSFMIPVGDDPGTIEYDVAGPAGEGQHVVWETNTTGYVHESLVANLEPGQPGRLPEPPRLTFATYLPGMMEMGRYRIGLACTFFRQTAHYWDTEIEIIADSDDFPAQFRWQVIDAPDEAVVVESSSAGGRNDLLFLGGAAAVLLGSGVYFWMRYQDGKNKQRKTDPVSDDQKEPEPV